MTRLRRPDFSLNQSRTWRFAPRSRRSGSSRSMPRQDRRGGPVGVRASRRTPPNGRQRRKTERRRCSPEREKGQAKNVFLVEEQANGPRRQWTIHLREGERSGDRHSRVAAPRRHRRITSVWAESSQPMEPSGRTAKPGWTPPISRPSAFVFRGCRDASPWPFSVLRCFRRGSVAARNSVDAPKFITVDCAADKRKSASQCIIMKIFSAASKIKNLPTSHFDEILHYLHATRFDVPCRIRTVRVSFNPGDSASATRARIGR